MSYAEPLTGASPASYSGAAMHNGRLPEEKLSLEPAAATKWRDPMCAAAFYVHLLLILFFAGACA